MPHRACRHVTTADSSRPKWAWIMYYNTLKRPQVNPIRPTFELTHLQALRNRHQRLVLAGMATLRGLALALAAVTASALRLALEPPPAPLLALLVVLELCALVSLGRLGIRASRAALVGWLAVARATCAPFDLMVTLLHDKHSHEKQVSRVSGEEQRAQPQAPELRQSWGVSTVAELTSTPYVTKDRVESGFMSP